MGVQVIRIELMPLDPSWGEWCDVCNLPSRVTIPFVLVDRSDLRVVGRDQFVVCTELDPPAAH